MKIKIWQNEYGIVGFSSDKTSVKYFKNVIFFNLMDDSSLREEMEYKRKEWRAKKYKPNPR